MLTRCIFTLETSHSILSFKHKDTINTTGLGDVRTCCCSTNVLLLSLFLDIPVKVVGMLPLRNERGMLLKMVYALFERLSFYRYGRIELNLFISEKEYLVS